MDHARKFKFRSYVYLPSINKMFQHHYARVILCNVGEVIIFEHGCYIPALEHITMLILSIYVILACINIIYKYANAWAIRYAVYTVSIFWLRRYISEASNVLGRYNLACLFLLKA